MLLVRATRTSAQGMFKTRWCVLYIYLFFPLSCADAENCVLKFTEQPVTNVDCNVYEPERLVLTCSVSSTESTSLPDPDDVCIKWYFNNGTEHELMVGINQTRDGGNGEMVEISSTLAISGISQQNAANIKEGSYYCRVHILDMNTMSNSSQQFVVLERSIYTQISVSYTHLTLPTNREV